MSVRTKYSQKSAPILFSLFFGGEGEGLLGAAAGFFFLSTVKSGKPGIKCLAQNGGKERVWRREEKVVKGGIHFSLSLLFLQLPRNLFVFVLCRVHEQIRAWERDVVFFFRVG